MMQRSVRQVFSDLRALHPRSSVPRQLRLAFAREIGLLRFLRLTRYSAVRVRTWVDPSAATQEIDYSKSWLAQYRPDRRVEWTMNLLAAIPDCRRDSLLIIGPRYETELIMAVGHGWNRNGVRGLDTHSYSPMVDVGDMHAMPYTEQQFSAIICAWTLSYSTQPDVAAKEIERVLAPGGYVVVSMQKIPRDYQEKLKGVLQGPERIQTLSQLDCLFCGLERVAGFEQDLAPHEEGNTVAAYRKPRPLRSDSERLVTAATAN